MAAPSFWEPPCALRAFRESSCARAGDGRGSVGGSIAGELILPCTRELRSRCVPRGRLLRKGRPDVFAAGLEIRDLLRRLGEDQSLTTLVAAPLLL